MTRQATLTLVLPYLTGKAFYRLALRPMVGPMRITELTVRLQSARLTWVYSKNWNPPPLQVSALT